MTKQGRKQWWFGCIGFVAGFAVCAFFGSLLCYARDVARFSNTAFPTRAIIEDIHQTLEDGDTELAKRKVAILKQKWQAWMDGGPAPVSFFREIQELKE